jgi:ribosome-binding ATPase
MQIGIVGLPYSGKTTVFNALSGQQAPVGRYVEGPGEVHRAIVNVPDNRLQKLAEIYQPKKVTHATVEFCDVGGFKKGASGDASVSAHLMGHLRDMDALALVVRVFERESVPHPDNRIDPAADLDTLLEELMMEDLAVAEKRKGRLTEQLGKGTQENRDKLEYEKNLIERLIENLNNSIPLRSMDFSIEEENILKGFGFLSKKALIVLANVGDLTSEIEIRRVEKLKALSDEQHLPWLAINADLECELRSIDDPAEQAEYMEAMGVTERSAGAVIQAAYRITNTINFLTAGEPEVRAWEVRKGSSAVEAAGRIHSDIARGFIRAEVVPYDNLIETGSVAKAREKGFYREEGREAVVHDGDVIHFKFNV